MNQSNLENYLKFAKADNVSQLPEKYILRAHLALRYGWYFLRDILSSTPTFDLFPPDSYECSNWDGKFMLINLGDYTVNVPHWFWNDNVLRTGTW